MPGPSPRLEAIVGMLIPPACREEVLGDLREKYVSPTQYIGLALGVVPCVILSRIRRTTDPQIRITEALLIYGSFLAATWYSDHSMLWYSDRSLLLKPEGMLWIALPTAANLIDLTFADVWRGGSRWPTLIVWAAAFGIGFAFNPFGELACVLLVRGLHLLPGRRLHEASGPSIEMDRKAFEMPAVAKSLLTAAGAIAMAALFLKLAGRPPGAATMGTIVVFVLVILFRKPRKE